MVHKLDRLIEKVDLSQSVQVHVYTATLETAQQAWVYVTKGIEPLRDFELTISVLCYSEETTYPDFPFKVFAYISQANAADLAIHPSVVLETPEQDRITGYVVQHADRWDGLELPETCYALIPLLEDEMRAALTFGEGRVLSLLGHYHRFFPFPFWLDRDRRAALDLEEHASASILAKVPRVPVAASCFSRGKTVTLTVSADFGDTFDAILEQGGEHGVGLLTQIYTGSDAAAYWQPGEKQRALILTEPAKQVPFETLKIGGSFLILSKLEDGMINSPEDGYAVFLPETEWSAFRKAVVERAGFRFEVDDLAFELAWHSERYVSQLGGTFQNTQNLVTEDITPPRDAKHGRAFAMDSVKLLIADEEIGQRVETGDLADYISDLSAAFLGVAADRPTEASNFIIRVELKQRRLLLRKSTFPKFEYATFPNCEQDFIDALHVALSGVKPPSVRGPVAFEIYLEDRLSQSPPQ